ncbi:unnamed protein product [Caenorhabditis angaria]|uniref:Serpentine Receptor, class H n=1 Tax=Caenorhabditis angaria TaxID=860376 RepID=A0A9P1IQF5_9PELO|nr:unnamed protein product [Caenorhabditis angaria]
MHLLGIFSWLGLPGSIVLLIGQGAVFSLWMSVIAVFQNRHSYVASIKYKFIKKRSMILYYFLCYLFGFAALSTYSFDGTKDLDKKVYLLETSPYKCPPIEYFDENTWLLSGKIAHVTIIVATMTALIIINSFYFVLTSAYHLTMVSTTSISKRTKNLQLKFLTALIIQICIPLVVLAFPVLAMCFILLWGIINQNVNHLLIIISGTHGILTSLSLILIHKPYRHHALKVIKCKREKVKSSNSVKIILNSNVKEISESRVR